MMYSKAIILVAVALVTLGPGIMKMIVKKECPSRQNYNVTSTIEGLFPHSKEEVISLFNKASNQLETDITAIVSQTGDKTFDSTFGALDRALTRFGIDSSGISALAYASPDKETREAALQMQPKFTPLLVDLVSLNEDLYAVLKEYAETSNKQLTQEQRYFIDETMRGFKRSGMELPQEKKDRLKELQKERAELGAEFDKNIAASDEKIIVDAAGLKGLEESFIKTLKRTEDGNYIIPTDYAHYYKVMEEVEVAQTRKQLFRAFNRRAYPANEKVLERIIALADEMAGILGYESAAQYSIEEAMAKTPQAVDSFVQDVRSRAWDTSKKEISSLIKEAPEGVLIENEKLFPWDVPYAFNSYKKKHFAIDEAKLAEYFPLQYTLPALLKIYEDFFGLSIKKAENITFWHEEVEAYAVYKDGVYRGMIILDMFPRPNKYPHAGHMAVVPAQKDAHGTILPSVGLLMVNFPRPHEERPSLLKRSEVTTFFHEFGHALHTVLGATELGSFSGTSVKTDFVEMPSQMLEEWLWDPTILKRISSHYKTGEPLPDEIIANLLKLKTFGKATRLVGQGFLASLSLAYYQPGANKDVYGIFTDLKKRLFTPGIYLDPEDRHYVSFIHLNGYGSMYYSYLWSQVYALDLFEKIKPYGLTNPEIGRRYSDIILARGGSKDPFELLEEFLQRKPSTDAFFKSYGI